MNDCDRVHATHVADQAIAELTAKLDGFIDQAAAALPQAGYERTVGWLTKFLVDVARNTPEAVAGLLAVAVTRLAVAGGRAADPPRHATT
jgi:hypothetical protein